MIIIFLIMMTRPYLFSVFIFYVDKEEGEGLIQGCGPHKRNVRGGVK